MESSLKENENIANNIKELTPSKIKNYDKEKLKAFIIYLKNVLNP